MNGTAASNFASEARDTDLLINIPLAKYGTLLGFVDSLDYIRDIHVRKSRSAHIRVMRNLLVAAATDKVLWWKRLLLLPLVLFSNQDKKQLDENAQKACGNEGDLKVSDFLRKSHIYEYTFHSAVQPQALCNINSEDTYSKTHRKFYELIKCGNMSKAMSFLRFLSRWLLLLKKRSTN
jgi:hypothetical protein